MNSSTPVRKFCKTVQCPSSDLLLRYRHCLIPVTDRFRIERHLHNCDFCSAELQLLGRFANEGEPFAVVEIPSPLRWFAEMSWRQGARSLPWISSPPSRSRLSH